MREFLLVFHLLVTLVLIGVILIQRGEDAGAGGGSGGLPGARSGKNPLTRVTAILAAIFFADCLGMAILIRKDSQIGTEPIGKSESAPKPSGTLPVVAAKQAIAVGSNKDQIDSAQRSSADDSGRTSGAKSAPVSSRSPAEASKPVVMTDSKKKPLKSSSKSSAKAKKKSKDRVKKSA